MTVVRWAVRSALVSVVTLAVIAGTAGEIAVPPDSTTTIVRRDVRCDEAVPTPPHGWASVPPMATGPGAVSSMQAVFDGDTGDVLVRVVTADGLAPEIFFDLDGDRLQGGWTYQTHVSAAAWNVHVDREGALFAHAGVPDEWKWAQIEAPAGFHWSRDGSATVVCLPQSLLASAGADPRDVAIAVAHDDDWLPHPFIDGVRLRSFDERPAVAPVRTPGRLAFAYQWAPWAVRDCPADTVDVACAAAVYGEFSHVVFGGGIDDPAHPSHDDTARLIAELRQTHPATEVWGYVSTLRHGDDAHDTAAIRARATRWRDMGATGVFLDEFDLCDPIWSTCGVDQGHIPVTRARQREAVEAVHALGLAVFANAHSIHGTLGDVRGEPTPLGAGDGDRPADMYLLENPTVWAGRWWTGLDRLASQARFRDAVSYVEHTGVRLAVVDTGRGVVADDADDPHYVASWWRAAQAGADAHAFTNADYSASDDFSDNMAILAAPAGAELLDRDGLQFLGGIELHEGGDRSQRALIDCSGRLIGEIVIDVDEDGTVHARPVVVPSAAGCPDDPATAASAS